MRNGDIKPDIFSLFAVILLREEESLLFEMSGVLSFVLSSASFAIMGVILMGCCVYNTYGAVCLLLLLFDGLLLADVMGDIILLSRTWKARVLSLAR